MNKLSKFEDLSHALSNLYSIENISLDLIVNEFCIIYLFHIDVCSYIHEYII